MGLEGIIWGCRMTAEMKTQPVLSDAEWKLVTELLERERTELPAEIHHTRTTAVKQALHERLDMVDRLLERLRNRA